MKNLLGYDYVDGKLVINEDEAKIVKYLYAKLEEYTENPPQELVERVLVKAREDGEELTYEEAKERVTHSAILEYITREMNSSEEFIAILKKSNPHSLRGQLKNTNSTCEPIIAKEIWDEAQQKMKEGI